MGTTFVPDDAADMTVEQKNHQLAREVGTSPIVELDIVGIERNSDGWTISYNDGE